MRRTLACWTGAQPSNVCSTQALSMRQGAPHLRDVEHHGPLVQRVCLSNGGPRACTTCCVADSLMPQAQMVLPRLHVRQRNLTLTAMALYVLNWCYARAALALLQCTHPAWDAPSARPAGPARRRCPGSTRERAQPGLQVDDMAWREKQRDGAGVGDSQAVWPPYQPAKLCRTAVKRHCLKQVAAQPTQTCRLPHTYEGVPDQAVDHDVQPSPSLVGRLGRRPDDLAPTELWEQEGWHIATRGVTQQNAPAVASCGVSSVPAFDSGR